MDGTLYDNTIHAVSPLTIEALYALQKRGNLVFLASSRTMRELDHLPLSLAQFPFDGKILDGGSRILNAQGNDLVEILIPEKTMKDIDDFCKSKQLIYRYSTNNGNYWGTCPDLQAHQIYFDLYLCAPVYKPYQLDKVLNVLIFCDRIQQKELLEKIGNSGVVCFDHAIEIRADHVDKIQGIEWCKKHYALNAILCFGDGQNDIEMLKGADIGLCMGNGHAALKEVADQVIGRVDQDGIYTYLKESQRI